MIYSEDKKFAISLRAFFTKEAKNLISTYKRLISNRQGIDLDDAPSNAPSTVAKKGFNHWMVETFELKDKGFNSKINDNGFSVFASKRTHTTKRGRKLPSKIPTYEDLFTWHNAKKYSGVFGNRMPKGSQFYQRLVKEVYKQLQPQIAREFTRRVKVNIAPKTVNVIWKPEK